MNVVASEKIEWKRKSNRSQSSYCYTSQTSIDEGGSRSTVVLTAFTTILPYSITVEDPYQHRIGDRTTLSHLRLFYYCVTWTQPHTRAWDLVVARRVTNPKQQQNTLLSATSVVPFTKANLGRLNCS